MTETIEGTNLPVRTSVTELARLGRKKEIRELSRRLADLSPGGMKLNDQEALALAQYSWSLGANPLVGETWLLKNHKSGQVLGLMPGIRLHRRRADEKDERNKDSRWVEYTNISDPDERATFAIPQNAMAIKARLYRQSTTKAYADAAEKLAGAGASWDEIKNVLGTKPYVEGVGILTKSEMDGLNRGQNKMPHKQRCEKRAEAHALKQAYHLPFGYVALSDEGMGIPDGATLDEYIIEGTFTDAPLDDPTRPDANDSLFDDEDEKDEERVAFTEPVGKKQWPPDKAEALRAAMITAKVVPPDAHNIHIANFLDMSPFGIEVPAKEFIGWAKLYRGYKDQTDNTDEAIRMASEAWFSAETS